MVFVLFSNFEIIAIGYTVYRVSKKRVMFLLMAIMAKIHQKLKK